MKVSMENDNNFGYEKITVLVDNMPLIERGQIYFYASSPDAAACRVCLPRKYGRFMLLN
jgi:hypothetical protein